VLDIIQKYLPNVWEYRDEMIQASWETLYMVFFTAIITGILGTIIGIILVVTKSDGILKNKVLYGILDQLINIMRSIPFVILLALVVPITRFIVGTSIGTTAALVPLTIGFTPFFARQVQNALLEVDDGVVEAAVAMGTHPFEIIWGVYLKEGLISIARVSAVTIIGLIDGTALAGAIGGGGLGNIAIALGYNRFKTDITVVATLIILLYVFVSQIISNMVIEHLSHD
jgi:D-methionine transport system permease protein